MSGSKSPRHIVSINAESTETRSLRAPSLGQRSSLQIGTESLAMGSRSEVGGSSTVRAAKKSSLMNARRYSGGEERSREILNRHGECSA